jgi:hypothetical protein
MYATDEDNKSPQFLKRKSHFYTSSRKTILFFIQCCKSGSALIWLSWIRIHIGNADPDSGARKMTKIYNLKLTSNLSKRLQVRFMTSPYMKYFFHVKPLVTANFVGSTLFWLPESRSALRLEARSRSALKPMRTTINRFYF